MKYLKELASSKARKKNQLSQDNEISKQVFQVAVLYPAIYHLRLDLLITMKL